MTKRGKMTILGVLVLFVVYSLECPSLEMINTVAQIGFGVPEQGVDATADYQLIPILNAQSTDMKQVYLNTVTTPTLFFATWSINHKRTFQQSKILSKMDTSMHKPLVLVSTFVKTTDPVKAIAEAKAFQQKNKVTLPIAVQVGPPTVFVKQVPSLVYTDDNGTHVVTDENKILSAPSTILTLPNSQKPTQQPTQK